MIGCLTRVNYGAMNNFSFNFSDRNKQKNTGLGIKLPGAFIEGVCMMMEKPGFLTQVLILVNKVTPPGGKNHHPNESAKNVIKLSLGVIRKKFAF